MPASRRLAAALAMSALALTLAACGGGGEDPIATPEASSEADPDAFPVTIEHKFGETEIAEPPERVVTVGYGEDDFALSLGVTPVGIREFIGEYAGAKRPWAKEELEAADPEEIGAEAINFEQVNRMNPDVILGVYSLMTERDYETLSKIAPTVAQTDEFIDGGVPWQDQLALDAEALGRGEMAEELTTETEGTFADAREEHPEFEGKTALLAAVDGDILYGYAPADPRARFFTDLGFETDPEIEDLAGEEFYAEFGREQADLYDQDVLVFLESATTQEEIESDPVFQRLDAFKEGRVVFVDADDQFAGALGFGSPLSLPYAIDGITPALEAAADGDPETEVPEVK